MSEIPSDPVEYLTGLERRAVETFAETQRDTRSFTVGVCAVVALVLAEVDDRQKEDAVEVVLDELGSSLVTTVVDSRMTTTMAQTYILRAVVAEQLYRVTEQERVDFRTVYGRSLTALRLSELRGAYARLNDLLLQADREKQAEGQA